MRGRIVMGFAALLLTVAAAPDRRDDGVTVAQINIKRTDEQGGVQRLLAPGTKVPKVGPNATELEYAKWAKNSLDRGQDAEAELSLEWGQARRRVDEVEEALAANKPPPPYDSLCQRMLCKAMQAIGKGDRSSGGRYLDTAISDIQKRTGVN